MRIGITGSTGLIGSALVPQLRAHGHEVVRFTRSRPAAPDERGYEPAARRLDSSQVADLDAVVHLAGAGIADKRWTDERKKVILDSRTDGTTAVAGALAAADGGPRLLLSASAIGYYGDGGDTVLDETAPSGQGFLAEVCRAWEDATEPAEQAGVRVVHLRTGLVLSPDGGLLGRTLPLYKLGLGTKLGSGSQWMSWISLRDEIDAIEHCLSADVRGPVNLVAPAPVTNTQYTKILNGVLHRPTLPIGAPAFALKLAVGEFAEEGILAGQRLRPTVLEASGFSFTDPELAGALRAMLDR